MLDSDGLNQSVLVTGLQKANKIFQPNLGIGQTSQIDLDFNKGKIPRKIYITRTLIPYKIYIKYI